MRTPANCKVTASTEKLQDTLERDFEWTGSIGKAMYRLQYCLDVYKTLDIRNNYCQVNEQANSGLKQSKDN